LDRQEVRASAIDAIWCSSRFHGRTDQNRSMAICAIWRQVRFHCSLLPFLRNVAAVLAGTNSMGQHSFYFASATAAVAWIICYGLAAYSFGEAFANLASPVPVFLGLAATLIILAAPMLILRYERCLLAKADQTVLNSIATSNFVTPTICSTGEHRTSDDLTLQRFG
jgi:hypothetical protein